MEGLLNLAWLILSLFAVIGWTAVYRKRADTLPLSYVRGLLLVLCVALLVFPVISVSDDLQAAVSFAEASRMQDASKKQLPAALDACGLSLLILFVILVVLARQDKIVRLGWLRFVSPSHRFLLVAPPEICHRPPPSSC